MRKIHRIGCTGTSTLTGVALAPTRGVLAAGPTNQVIMRTNHEPAAGLGLCVAQLISDRFELPPDEDAVAVLFDVLPLQP
jgi:hypothetical protein